MTVNNLFCSQCGMAVANESRYCFKCGSEIQKTSAASSEPYQLDEKFKPNGSKLFTNLEYSGHGRVWILDGGFEKLHGLVNELCDLAYRASCSVAPSDSENRCYDTISNLHFHRHETDYYPVDGYESIFVQFSDFIPSPFGNLGVRPDDTDFDRSLCIFMGKIEYDPTHGEGNYADTKPPRLRKSKLVEKWGIDVKQKFVNRQPTSNFSYSLTAHTLSSISEYSPNYKGLLTTLGLHAVTENKLKSLPEVSKALSGTNGSIVFQLFHQEIWQPLHSIWQPYFDVEVKTGWFSSEQRRILLEPSKDNRPPSKSGA